MTWPTHQAGALLAALGLNLPLTAVAASLFGAILPDVADQSVSRLAFSRRRRQKIFNKIHRGHSHWFGWWLPLFLMPLCLPLPDLVRDALAGLALGALSHLALDMLTPRGVPLFPFGKGGNVAIPLCSTGKPGEYALLCLLLLGVFLTFFSISPVQGGLLALWRGM